MDAAAEAHLQTGVPITTHTHAASQNGRDQLQFFRERGVDPERLIIGHCGDSQDLDYLRELMDAGATIGMDRFGMEHVLADEARVETVLALLRLGYADRMVALARRGVLQPGDAAVVAGAARAALAPWRTSRAASCRAAGAAARPRSDIHQLLVINPARLLTPPRRTGSEG